MTTRDKILKNLRKLHKKAFKECNEELIYALDIAIAFAQGRSDDEALLVMEDRGLIEEEKEED